MLVLSSVSCKINNNKTAFKQLSANITNVSIWSKKQEIYLSYDVAVIQWVMSCHNNRVTTRVIITLWRVHVTSFTTSVSTTNFLIEIKLILKAIKYSFKGSYDKQNHTLVVISYEIYETRRRLRRVS